MRRNVNRNVFNDRKNVSATTSPTTTASPLPADEVEEGDAEDEDGDGEDDEEGRQELRINIVARFDRPRLYRWFD